MRGLLTFFIPGALGYRTVKSGRPLAPLILGVIVGGRIEERYTRTAMTDAGWKLLSLSRGWASLGERQ